MNTVNIDLNQVQALITVLESMPVTSINLIGQIRKGTTTRLLAYYSVYNKATNHYESIDIPEIENVNLFGFLYESQLQDSNQIDMVNKRYIIADIKDKYGRQLKIAEVLA